MKVNTLRYLTRHYSPGLIVRAGPGIRLQEAEIVSGVGEVLGRWPAVTLTVRQGEEVVVVAGTAAVGEHLALLLGGIKVESLQLTPAGAGVRRLPTVRLLLHLLLLLLVVLLLVLLGFPAGSLALSESVEVVVVSLTASEGELPALS